MGGGRGGGGDSFAEPSGLYAAPPPLGEGCGETASRLRPGGGERPLGLLGLRACAALGGGAAGGELVRSESGLATGAGGGGASPFAIERADGSRNLLA